MVRPAALRMVLAVTSVTRPYFRAFAKRQPKHPAESGEVVAPLPKIIGIGGAVEKYTAERIAVGSILLCDP